MFDMMCLTGALSLLILIFWRQWRSARESVDGPAMARFSRLKRALPYGLALAAAVVYGIGTGKTDDLDRRMQLQRLPRRLDHSRAHLETIAALLRDYHEKTGRWPTNDQGLSPVAERIDAIKKSKSDTDLLLAYLRTGEGGVYTMWGDPFIYENRTGLPGKAFAHSSATDSSVPYSIRVADGIYVWSVGVKEHYEILREWGPRLRLYEFVVRFIALSLFGMSVLCAIVYSPVRPSGARNREHIFWKITGLSLMTLVAAIFAYVPFVKTCYEASITYRMRPELTKEYLALVEKYHDNGVISDRAYEKITESSTYGPKEW